MVDLAGRDLAQQMRDAIGRLDFLDYRVTGNISLDDFDFPHPVVFRRCEFDGNLTFFKPNLASHGVLVFECCKFTTLRIQWPSWQRSDSSGREIISLRDSDVRDELAIQVEDGRGSDSDQNSASLSISNCFFERNWRIINGSCSTRISLVRCRASQSASGSISCSDLSGLVELERCDIDGRLVCGVYARERPKTPLRGIFGFYGTIIRGQVELCTASQDEVLAWIDMRDARIVGGRISISTSPLGVSRTYQRAHIARGSVAATMNWLWKSSWDNLAFVLDEILVTAPPNLENQHSMFPQRIQDLPNVADREVVRELHADAYSQYDELRQSYTQTSGADDLEDFCKYRMSVYRSFSVMERGNRFAAVLCALLAAVLLLDWVLGLSAFLDIQIMPWLWIAMAIWALFNRRLVIPVIQFAFFQVFLRHMLGPVSYTHLTLPTNREV